MIDLAQRLGLPRDGGSDEPQLVVLKANAELGGLRERGFRTTDDKIGFLVDRISDVVGPAPGALEPPPPNLDALSVRYLWGVCKTPRGTLAVLNLEELLRHEPSAVERYDPPAQAG